MRVAAYVYVVALRLFEVQSQQQCSESLGSCSGSRASLMQLKSFSQKLQTSSGRGASTHAETLAGFQKYTSELVDKYLQDPSPQHNALGQEVLDAIKIIKDYLLSLYQDLLEFHSQDFEASRWCREAEDRCFNRTIADNFENTLSSMDSAVSEKRVAHETCRAHLRGNCSINPEPVCPNYHRYRRDNVSAIFPACGKRADLKLAKETWTSGDDNLDTFEACLPATQTWVDALYHLYDSCDEESAGNAPGPVGCRDQQRQFEEAYCTRLNFRDTNCHLYDLCKTHAEDHCKGSSKAEDDVGTCGQVEANALARMSDNETAERISCLLDVLTANDTDKADGLTACHERDFTQVNAFWNITCAVTNERALTGCGTRDPDGCGDEFVATYYSGNDKLGVEQSSSATCCQNADGLCYDSCRVNATLCRSQRAPATE